LFIKKTFEKFNPSRKTGHLLIGNDDLSLELPTDDFEFEFSKKLPLGATYVFFEQDSLSNDVFILQKGNHWSQLIQECYGMEYFLTDTDNTYFVSVNWYSIEILDLEER
jgi:hypothetical protein